MKILGIDPSLTATGWGLIEVDGPRLVHIDHGVIRTKSTQDIQDRLFAIRIGVSQEMGRLSMADLVVVEETPFVGGGQASAGALNRAQGAVLSAIPQYAGNLRMFGPPTWRKLVGIANKQEKAELKAAAIHRASILLGMDEPPTSHDAAEALCIAIAGSVG